MSYYQARLKFEENEHCIDPQTEPIMYNINNGLKLLTQAIEQDMNGLKLLTRAIERDMREIKDKLVRISHRINNI